MIPLPLSAIAQLQRELRAPEFGLDPIQLGMPTPWHVVVASMVRLRSKKWHQEMTRNLLTRWPTPLDMALAEKDEMYSYLNKVSTYKSLSHGLINMSIDWCSAKWSDLRDVTGVGIYVADCVGLFCFGCTDLASHNQDLQAYIQKRDEAARKA